MVDLYTLKSQMSQTPLHQIYFTPNTIREDEESKVKTPIERAEALSKRLKKLANTEMSKGIYLGPKVKNSVKVAGILARLKVRQKHQDWKSQKVNETFTTKKDAWRKGIITNIPDKKTMYFTGKQTSYDTAVVFRQAIKVK